MTEWKALTALALLALGAAGCSRDDPDRLAKIGRLALEKTGETLEVIEEDWFEKAPARDRLRSIAVARRVQYRLRYDKSLAGLPIEVSASGGVVELKGKVADTNQHRRAVDLAQSTTGVDKVEDKLDVDQ